MRIKDIEECCHAIDHLRILVATCRHDDPKFMEFSSDLLQFYQELLDNMQEEIKFLESVSIK